LQTPRGSLALAGFPFVRTGIRRDFLNVVEQTGWRRIKADGQVLCLHQSVDGATVGPSGYMFRYAHDVIRIADIPREFCAVLAGHIHRFQVLTRDLKGKPLAAPVFYPGSIERTSFAEKDEKKGYLILAFETTETPFGKLKNWAFHELPARPMVQLELHATGMNGTQMRAWIQSHLYEIPPDSIVKIKVHDKVSDEAMAVFSTPALRALAPETMNISATLVEYTYYRRHRQNRRRS
jgi:DNA repair exonuclease SbcCD nuclease subunit